MHAFVHGCWSRRTYFFIFVLFFLIPETASAMRITPLRETVIVEPGGKEAVSVHVKNDTRVAASVHMSVDAFTIDEKTGRAVFGATDDAITWVRATTPDISLKAGEEKEAIFLVHVPNDAQPAGHYLGLFAEEKPADGNVGIGSRIGTLLFLYVGGAVREELAVQSFGFDRPFAIVPPTRLTLALRNIGGIHVIPQGIVSLQNRRGDTIGKFLINANQKKVLPGGVWREEYVLQDLPLQDAGHVAAIANIQYGISAKHIFGTASLWYAPPAAIGIGAAIFLLCVIVVIVLHLRGKRRV